MVVRQWWISPKPTVVTVARLTVARLQVSRVRVVVERWMVVEERTNENQP